MNKAQRELFRNTLADLTGTDVSYSWEPAPEIDPNSALQVTVSKIGNASSAFDTIMQTRDSGLVATNREFRYALYSIRVDSLNVDRPADEITENLAIQMWRRATLDGLNRLDLAVVDVSNVFELPVVRDAHVYTASAIQVKLGYVITDTDEDYNFGVIESVDLHFVRVP